ncbi:MAG: DUF2993 domain-containing protein [Thermovirgaceae bacterium]|nr:DUF2993 domain-containing protein [Thermovirgaceae bacterium]
MRLRNTTALAMLMTALLAGSAWAGNVYTFSGTLDKTTSGPVLFKAFADGLKPESIEMILDEEPDETGRVGHIYLDLYGCNLGGVRIDHLEIEAVDVKFTPPGEWGEKGPDIEKMLAVYAQATILEKDVNAAIAGDAFGDDDGNWHDISLDFRDTGVYVKGYYLSTFLLRLDILIELEGRFGIVGGKQVWLKDYTMRVNRVDIPDFLTERAISKIQPIIDLEEFIFPLTLKTVIQKDDRVTLQSRVLPSRFSGDLYKFRTDTATAAK